MHKYKILFLLMLLVCLSLNAYAKNTTEVYQNAKKSVVLIVVYDSMGIPSSLGSGFYFEKNKIATNYHVIENASKIVFKHIGSKTFHPVAKISSYSKSLDLAILSVKKAGNPLTIRSNSNVNIGEKIIAIGNPRGLEGSVSEGIISATRGDGNLKYFQITTPISPGSSGGPLFDENGNVIGVTTATLKDSQNLNFAMPAKLLLSLKNKGQVWEPIIAKKSRLPATKGSGGIELILFDFKDVYGNMQYSLKNANQSSVKNISYILIFREKRTREVVHFVLKKESRIIPPGLAKRIKFEDRSLDGFMNRNRYPYMLGDGYLTALVDVELRVLTYDFVNSNSGKNMLDSIL
jgi:Trypsin-like peptidase domain